MSDTAINLTLVIAYFIGVLVLGIWIGRREKADKEGFFLGGKHFSWLLIGASLFATNISSIQFVGQSGLAYKIGIAAANPQLCGGLMLALSAVFFIPMYLRSGLFTIPAFLEKRYNQKCKIVFACTMIVVGLVLGPVLLYAGSLVILELFNLDAAMLPWAALILGAAVGVYAISGGLSSVVYTDLLQAVVLLIGGIMVVIFGISEAGGLSQLFAKAPAGSLEMVRPADDPDMPFLGVITGGMLVSLYWASSSQDLLQRALGAKDLRNAQLGMLLGAALKIVAIFLIVFPGIIAAVLLPEVHPDRSYPALIQSVLPVGVSGIVLAGFLAALMSSVDSSLMSLSSVIAIDIYPLFKKKVSEKTSLKVGRWVATGLLLWGIALAPIVQHAGLIYPLILKVGAYMSTSIGVCYLVGRFSRRVNAAGALTTLVLGIVVGVFLVLATSVPIFNRAVPDWLVTAHFYKVAAVLSILYAIVLLAISYATRPPNDQQLAIVDLSNQSLEPADGESVPLWRSFKFWFGAYIAAFLGVYLVF